MDLKPGPRVWSTESNFEQSRAFRATPPNFEQTVRIPSKPPEFRASVVYGTRGNFEQPTRISSKPSEFRANPGGVSSISSVSSGTPRRPQTASNWLQTLDPAISDQKTYSGCFRDFRAASGDVRGFPRKVNVLYGDFRLSRPFLTTHME